ncbi:MAG: leucine-rich repeat domain-containing protein [Clostridia bacterium]|nr:leucine-rich repeat domain-containing protein [Clostridia bacterium]
MFEDESGFVINNGILEEYDGPGGHVVVPEGVKHVGFGGRGMFMDREDISDVLLPNGVKSIEQNAFIGCTGLKSIVIPGSVYEIDCGVFIGCTALTSVHIENGVTRIREYAFHGCTALTNIVIPNSVTEIEKYAFDDCPHLTIQAHLGSFAEKYAIENGIPFTSL